jgi:hypothetical protein
VPAFTEATLSIDLADADGEIGESQSVEIL